MRSFCFILSVFVFLSCSNGKNPDIFSISLKTLEGTTYTFDKTTSCAKVFVFMSPECPLCVNYTRTLNELKSKYSANGIAFFAIFPGTYYTSAQIDSFRNQYQFEFLILLDTDMKLTQKLMATVTPEAVLLDKSGEIAYSGAIDNWAYATGKKRQLITHKYLEKAIDSIVAGNKISPAKTEPVGCYIEL